MSFFNPYLYSRRDALKTLWAGFGYTAFAGLVTQAAAKESAAKKGPLDAKPTHFPARAKHVIFLCMSGGPSHVDTFDYKPELQKNNGKSVANRNRGGYAQLLASPWTFAQHGKSGLWISELFPEVAKQAGMTDWRAVTYDRPISLLSALAGGQATVPTVLPRADFTPRLWYLLPAAEVDARVR